MGPGTSRKAILLSLLIDSLTRDVIPGEIICSKLLMILLYCLVASNTGFGKCDGFMRLEFFFFPR